MGISATLRDWLGFSVETAQLTDAQVESTIAAYQLRSAAVYIAVSYVANALSKCEIRTYEGGEPVKGELHYALNVSPNANQNGSAFINELVERIFYQGHALMVQPSPTKAQFFIASAFERNGNPLKGDVFSGVSIKSGTASETLRKQFKASDCCYFRLENREVMEIVRGLYAELGEVLGAAKDGFLDTAGGKFALTGEGGPGGRRGEEMEQQRETEDRYRAFLKNPRVLLPLYRGQDIRRIDSGGVSAADFVAIRKDVFETVAAAFHISPSMLYGNMTNIADIMQQFVTFGVDPLATMISDELTRKFYPFEAWDGGRNFIRVDTSQISHLDMFEVADKADKLIGSGAASIDEVRTRLNMDALGEDYSGAHWVTKNYSPIGDAFEQLQLDLSGGGEK